MKTKDWSCVKEALTVLASFEQEWVTSYSIGVDLVIPPDKLHRVIEACRQRGRNCYTSDTARTHMIAQALHHLSIQGMVDKRKADSRKNEYRITEKGRARLAKLEQKEMADGRQHEED